MPIQGDVSRGEGEAMARAIDWARRRVRGLHVAIILGLGLASPALAWSAPAIPGTPSSCTTTYDPLLARWETVCSDGARAITRYEQVLDRYETAVLSGPRRDCTGRRNPATQQVEVHCR
jgi:hypothetical protein